jgi:hypothetical protein
MLWLRLTAITPTSVRMVVTRIASAPVRMASAVVVVIVVALAVSLVSLMSLVVSLMSVISLVTTMSMIPKDNWDHFRIQGTSPKNKETKLWRR